MKKLTIIILYFLLSAIYLLEPTVYANDSLDMKPSNLFFVSETLERPQVLAVIKQCSNPAQEKVLWCRVEEIQAKNCLSETNEIMSFIED